MMSNKICVKIEKTTKEEVQRKVRDLECFGYIVKSAREGGSMIEVNALLDAKYVGNKELDRLFTLYNKNKRPISSGAIASYIIFILSIVLFIIGIIFRFELWGVILTIIFGLLTFMSFFFALSSFFMIKERKQIKKEVVEEAYLITHP